MKNIKLSFILIFTISQNLGFGQSDSAILFTVVNGFSQNNVISITQDHYGFMWFATRNGLNLFDGIQFKVFQNEILNDKSLSNSTITALFEDKLNNLWVGTYKGLNKFDRKKQEFKRFYNIINDNSTLAASYVSALCDDKSGNLLVGTFGGGLNVFNSKDEILYHFRQFTTGQFNLSNDFVTCLLRDKKDRVWVGTRHGLNLFDSKLYPVSQFFCDKVNDKSIGNDYITAITQDLNGIIWIATTKMGLYKVVEDSNGNFSFIKVEFFKIKAPFYESIQILSLMVDPNNNLWIGTENAGLFIYNSLTDKSQHYEKKPFEEFALKSNSIYSIYKSVDNIIWIGTYDQGVCKYDPNRLHIKRYYQNPSAYNVLNNNNVKAFAVDNESLWIGTDGGGLSNISLQTHKHTTYLASYANNALKSNAIMCLLRDNKHNLWIGSWNGGIYVKKSGQPFFKQYSQCITSNGPVKIQSVTALLQDRNNKIWAANFESGLMYYNESLDSFVQFEPNNKPFSDLLTANIYSIYQTSDGCIWLGTQQGAYCVTINGDKNSVVFYDHNISDKNSISSSYILSFVEDNNKALWIGTFGGGVNKIDLKTRKIESFTTDNGLSNNVIRCMLKDDFGNIWISTDRGITRLDPKTNSFKSMVNDVVEAAGEFQGSAGIRDREGNIYFGSNNGFLCFNPNTIQINKNIPKVYITGFKLFNKDVAIDKDDSPLKEDIRYSKSLTLNYNQTVFTLEFAALSYTESNRNQYAYMLEGFDKTWNFIGHNNSATYTNLNPGTYLFKVKGSNNDGVWSSEPCVLEIKIRPAPWATWWAKLLYIIVAVFIIRYLLRFYNMRSSEKELLRLERIRFRNEEELNQKKIQFFTNISHEIRTPLSLIISPIEKLKNDARLPQELQEVVNFAYLNSRRLYRLINELLDFRKIDNQKLKLQLSKGDVIAILKEIVSVYNYSAKTRNIQLLFVTEYSSFEMWFDANKLEKIIHNLLSNALKFTPDNGEICLKFNIDVNQSFAFISVEDNGIGIENEHIEMIFDRFYQIENHATKKVGAGTGIGLALSRELAIIHKGDISVTSMPNVSTVFTLELPIDISCYDTVDFVNQSAKDICDNKIDDEYVINESEKNNALTFSKNKPVLLLVEDNVDVRTYLKSDLKEKFNIVEAENGQVALELVKSENPILIISDVMMPVMDGYELCKSIKNNIETCHIPFILLTAKVDEDDNITGLQIGADAYMSKPFSIRILVATIDNLIERRRQIYKVFSQEAVILPSSVTSNKLDEDFLNRVIEYIHSNITEPELGVESLAAYMNMSRSQIYRKVKAITNMSANEFIRLLRLKKSLKLLEDGKHTISEVSYLVGFNAPSYFASCFKEQFGKTPTEVLSKRND